MCCVYMQYDVDLKYDLNKSIIYGEDIDEEDDAKYDVKGLKLRASISEFDDDNT